MQADVPNAPPSASQGPSASSRPRLGLWIVGARGGVAVTTVVGLAALRRGLTGTTGLVTSLPMLARAGLPAIDSIVTGGHDIRMAPSHATAKTLAECGAIPPGLVEAVAEDLDLHDQAVRPGVLHSSGGAIESLADAGYARSAGSARHQIDLIRADLDFFRAHRNLDRVVVMLLGSTEPPVDPGSLPARWRDLAPLLERSNPGPLRASSLYAIAALELGMPVVNFTPSLGTDCPALLDLAEERGAPVAGRDGKTGETLLKSVLAPMFAHRNLEVMSWVGHNIFGNMDGQVLDAAENKQTKVRSKDHLLSEVLGYAPQTLVSIEYIRSLGDWKTAWDHVHFRGFLGVPMTLQLTWQGCDSALAAPLVIDLARLVARSAERGERGPLVHLASFFKSPMGPAPHPFADQFALLQEWARGASQQS